MSNLGIGVMIGMLSGNEETVKAYQSAQGKETSSISLVDDELRISFTDGTGIVIWDDGQSCCEHRYMTTDDDLRAFVGATLTSIELRDAPSKEDEWGEHEVQFLLVNTSLGTFTMETHNEHNGYYGGFLVRIKEAK